MLGVRKKQIEAGSLILLTALRASLWVDSFIRTNQQRQALTMLKKMEVFMIRAFKKLTAAVAFLLLIAGCQAMTGETAGQNMDDGTLTTYVKTALAGERVNTLTRVGVETNNGIVVLTGEVETAQERSRAGTVAGQVKGVRQVVNNLQVINR
jgi:hyperosmotically inducible protein